jgi:predicted Zn-dependent protease
MRLLSGELRALAGVRVQRAEQVDLPYVVSELEFAYAAATGRWAAARVDGPAAAADTGALALPPRSLLPNEQLGAALLAAGDARGAAAAYARALGPTPNRSAVLLGLARDRAAAGDSVGARAAYARLAGNWRRADPDLPALVEARRGAGGSPPTPGAVPRRQPGR